MSRLKKAIKYGLLGISIIAAAELGLFFKNHYSLRNAWDNKHKEHVSPASYLGNNIFFSSTLKECDSVKLEKDIEIVKVESFDQIENVVAKIYSATTKKYFKNYKHTHFNVSIISNDELIKNYVKSNTDITTKLPIAIAGQIPKRGRYFKYKDLFKGSNEYLSNQIEVSRSTICMTLRTRQSFR